MMGFKRNRPRPERTNRLRPGSALEGLESRCLMASNPYSFAAIQPRTVTPGSGRVFVTHPIGLSDAQIARQDNEGRVITGKDREGDEYVLTVHGPGRLVVTDATPNDGALDDDLDTIQILGSDPHTTYVTGQVTATARNVTSDTTGVVLFNHLISQRGVHSIVLNGFTLSRTVVPIAGQPNDTGPEIFLPGGVNLLSFHNIVNETDLAGNGFGPDQGFEVVIGDPTTPLKRQQTPTIQIDHIYNTVFDSTATTQEGIGPQTDSTVTIQVNGTLHALNIASATARTINGGLQFNFPRVDVTGRTAVRAIAVDNLKVTGSARNLTASRAGLGFQPQNGQTGTPTRGQTQPFSGAFSGLKHLKSATFGGNADGVGLDVSSGKIGKVKFLKGAGDPTGAPTNATQYGFNSAQAGYPSRGLTGALVVGKKIGKVTVGPSRLNLITAQDPDFAQLDRQGSTKYYPRAGQALVNAAIVSAGSIGEVNQVGDSQSSEIDAGNDYRSFANGLEPVRARSQIGKFRQRGDLVDSVVSASYRTNGFNYQGGQAGPGTIKGTFQGRVYRTGRQTILSNTGSGVFARRKIGKLPG